MVYVDAMRWIGGVGSINSTGFLTSAGTAPYDDNNSSDGWGYSVGWMATNVSVTSAPPPGNYVVEGFIQGHYYEENYPDCASLFPDLYGVKGSLIGKGDGYLIGEYNFIGGNGNYNLRHRQTKFSRASGYTNAAAYDIYTIMESKNTSNGLFGSSTWSNEITTTYTHRQALTSAAEQVYSDFYPYNYPTGYFPSGITYDASYATNRTHLDTFTGCTGTQEFYSATEAYESQGFDIEIRTYGIVRYDLSGGFNFVTNWSQ